MVSHQAAQEHQDPVGLLHDPPDRLRRPGITVPGPDRPDRLVAGVAARPWPAWGRPSALWRLVRLHPEPESRGDRTRPVDAGVPSSTQSMQVPPPGTR